MKTFFSFFIIFLFSPVQAQKTGDTLYFNFDEEYLEIKSYSPTSLYPINTQGQEESFFFIKKDTILIHSTPSRSYSLKDFLHEKTFVEKNRYEDLVRYLRRFEVFLVKKEKHCTYLIRVIPNYEVY